MLLRRLHLTFLFFVLAGPFSSAQIVITTPTNPQELVSKLLGDGVSISNVSFTGNLLMSGIFVNNGPNNINLDSGIILTSGTSTEVSGNALSLSNTLWGLPGDVTLANAIGVPVSLMGDACILEFDFVPHGDTVQFRYVFSSEEYTPDFVCQFNDAFGFFISGPGITGTQNIALIPGTNTPVSILNVNNVRHPFLPLCPNNIAYYVDNTTSSTFSHDGHTLVFTAIARVQPCQTYHLKIVIADNADDEFDSGVFLEAKSLSSNTVTLTSNTAVAQSGENYLVEGCTTGTFSIKRPVASPLPLVVNLQYAGTGINGTDLQLMPSSVIIPSNQTTVNVPVIPIVDNLSEGIELVKVIAFTAGCGSSALIPIDSTIFQIRDYDTLGVTPDTANICRNTPKQLNATVGYNSYQWSPASGLNNSLISNPVAIPLTESTTYIATARTGNCNARDSVFLKWKVPKINSIQNVNCQGSSSGQIVVSGGNQWVAPLQFSINGSAYQSSGTFNNVTAGNHIVRIRDATGCTDSIVATVLQIGANVVISSTVVKLASCLGGSLGSITVTAGGGNGIYQYSIDGITYQALNVLNLPAGTYTITVKDGNGCTASLPGIVVGFVNTVQLSTSPGSVICQGSTDTLSAFSNAQSITWFPITHLSNSSTLNPVVAPPVTTTYYITATTGICTKRDSVTIRVNPAPKADAGADVNVCYGGTTRLIAGNSAAYNWSPGTYLSDITVRSPEVLKPLSSINYFLSVTDVNGCTSLKRDTVKVLVTAAVKLFAGNDTAAAIRQPLQLKAVQDGANAVINYTWLPAEGLSSTTVSNPIAVLDKDMTYFVKGTTAENCEGIDTIKIKIYKGPDIYVPSVFTPNNDGRNDVLKAIAVGMKAYRYFKIYNRWGSLVFSTTDFNKGWDGKIKGIMQNTESFVWIAETVDFRGNLISKKGITTIIK